MNHFFRIVISVLAASSLFACAPAPLNPRNADALKASQNLSAAQHKRVVQESHKNTEPKIWFAGFALHSGSTAFRADIDLAARRMTELNPNTLTYLYSNEPQMTQLVSPFAHIGAIREASYYISKQVHTGDLVTILLTSHGYKKIIATRIGELDYDNMTDQDLATALAPLEQTPTLLIISACYSGSLIPALQSPNRIILTAASAERSSYGCGTLSTNTFFIEELLKDTYNPQLSIIQLFTKAKEHIKQREIELKIVQSEPQIFVGENMQKLAEMPQVEWFPIIESSDKAK